MNVKLQLLSEHKCMHNQVPPSVSLSGNFVSIEGYNCRHNLFAVGTQ